MYVLASASPRRKELLRQILPEFEIVTPDVDESVVDGEGPWQTAERLASSKAQKVLLHRPDATVVAADTVVAYQEDARWMQLGKPQDGTDARRMLQALSGRSHIVVTGVSVATSDASETFSITTQVTMRHITDEEISEYVGTGEPMDKAGAYAIQGGAKRFITAHDGSTSNVIGLPVEETRAALKRLES